MEKIFFVLLVFVSNIVLAQETIMVMNALPPSHSGTAHTLALVDTANKIQNKYRFQIEFKPGGFESIALKQVLTDPRRYLSVHTNTVAEAVDRGWVDIDNYVPVFSQGDFCWMAISTLGPLGNQLSDISKLREIVVGTPALGGATHLLALELGKKYNVPVKLVLFQSNFDAFVNQVANNGVNFSVERVSNFNQYKDKNLNLRIIGALCPSRHPDQPEIKTVAEQGIDSPLIWQTILASKNMNTQRRQEITEIFSSAERTIGQQEIFKWTDQIPPLFYGVSSEQHFRNNWKKLNNSRDRWRSVFKENK